MVLCHGPFAQEKMPVAAPRFVACLWHPCGVVEAGRMASFGQCAIYEVIVLEANTAGGKSEELCSLAWIPSLKTSGFWRQPVDLVGHQACS